MNLFISLKSALLSIPAVAAIVASDAHAPDPTTARIWNSWERKNAYPCIIMDIDREAEQNDLSGRGDLIIAEVTVTCRDNTHDGSDALQQAVRAGLAGYSGDFQAVLDDTTHAEPPKGDGSTAHWYDHVMSFTMFWNE
ncbi:MAG: hypothetical protein ABSG68_26815 [Thermoguttaceae bacterium]|jgi:hypothetical protein